MSASAVRPIGNDAIVREALERCVKAVTLRPAAGTGTHRSRTILQPGLACVVQERGWTLTVGMAEAFGGTGAGPTPGVLGRGALGSCLAIGYAMWAARLHVPIDALTVDVEADYDSRGELGLADDVPAGYGEVRYIVTIESAAPSADILHVLDTADRCSAYHDVFSRAQPMRRVVHLVPPAGGAGAAANTSRRAG